MMSIELLQRDQLNWQTNLLHLTPVLYILNMSLAERDVLLFNCDLSGLEALIHFMMEK